MIRLLQMGDIIVLATRGIFSTGSASTVGNRPLYYISADRFCGVSSPSPQSHTECRDPSPVLRACRTLVHHTEVHRLSCRLSLCLYRSLSALLYVCAVRSRLSQSADLLLPNGGPLHWTHAAFQLSNDREWLARNKGINYVNLFN